MKNAFWDWFAGFTDGEGCFSIVLAQDKNINLKYGLRIYPRFSIYLKSDDVDILREIKKNLVEYGIKGRIGVGISNSYERCWLQIDKMDSCKKLCTIFDAHVLRAKKRKDFELWKKAIDILMDPHHDRGRSKDELIEIVTIKQQMNAQGKRSKWTVDFLKRHLEQY